MKQKIETLMLTLRTYWERPRKNEYVNYREVSSFCVGAVGVKSLNSMLSFIQLAPTCLLIASVYGLSPRDIMTLFVITNIITIVKTPFVSMLVDNTNSKIGKFRPYLLWAGIPTVLSIIGLTWCVPMNASATVKIVLIGIYFNILSIAQPLYNNAYMGISQVITPNSQERTNILSVSEFLGNLGPSITAFIVPTLAGLFFGKDGMLDIRAYRILMPGFALVGFALGLLVMRNTKERVIQVEEKREKIRFWEGLRQISHNRYFWIVTISKFFDGFKGVLTLLLTWVCAYQIQNSGIQGVVSTVVSIGFTPGILLAPLMMKKLGSKNAAFFSHLLNFLAAVVMLFTFKKGFLFFVVSLFFYNFACGPQYIMQTSILSDGFDYQQEKEGVRLEGIAQNFQLMITTIGTILSTVVFTFIYESHGLVANAQTGLTDYTVLRDAAIREPIISNVIIVVMIAGLLAAIPYLFCHLKAGDMERIRLSLERKKFLAEHHLERATEEEQERAAAQFLLEREREEKRVADELQRQKDEAASSEQADEKAAAVRKKEQHARLAAERKALSARRKEFIRQEVRRAKREGERGYLHILAREKFEQILWEEQAHSQREEEAKPPSIKERI